METKNTEHEIQNILDSINLYRIPNESYFEAYVRITDRYKKDLRDEFAMAAITGILVNAKGEHPSDVYAKCAYAVADAMLAVREEK